MPFKIIRDDITKVKADAIVNTANPHPIYASGTDAAIYKAAGAEELLKERQKIGEIKRGQVAVTPAFALQADYITGTCFAEPCNQIGGACAPFIGSSCGTSDKLYYEPAHAPDTELK